MPSDDLDGKHGVQSLEVGMRILRAMAAGRRAMMLKDIAQAAEMTPSKAHRYLVSLIRTGFVEQERHSSHYDLGPFALNLGLVALDRIDRIRLGMQAISELRDQTNETIALMVWGEGGPVVVRWERPYRMITVNVVTGVTLSLLRSAGGQVFAAWLPEGQTNALIEAELERGKTPPAVHTLAQARQLLAQVRERGLAVLSSSSNYYARGVEAAAAPVFNMRGDITMAIALVGVEGTLDLSASSSTLAALRHSANTLSQRLGAPQEQWD
ncbi:MAG: IclR family transcriptional regulator [Comamonas sp.]|nr:IclR family transcriptional regulator [Comamonas sp.]